MQKPRVEFKLGAQVQATDGDFGNLHQLILSPLDRRVVALIVRRAMPPCDVVVPIAEVADASEQRVWLRVRRADLDERPALDRADYVELPAGNQGYAAGEALLTLYGGAGATHARWSQGIWAPMRRSPTRAISLTKRSPKCCKEEKLLWNLKTIMPR